MKIVSSCALLLFVFTALARLSQAEDSDSAVPPIVAIKDATPQSEAITFGKEPTVIKTEAEAAKLFGEKALEALMKQVDFKQQIVLVFAWKGSGQDKLEYDVAESSPEQITFRIERGRTRDLRPHVKIFALRADVKWKQ